MTERQTRLAVPTEPPSASRAPKAPTRPRALALAAVLTGSLAALGLCLYAAAGLVEAPWPQTALSRRPGRKRPSRPCCWPPAAACRLCAGMLRASTAKRRARCGPSP